MGKDADARLVVGATIHVKATFVTSFSECSRQFEALAGTKLVSGAVKDIIRGIQNVRRTTRLLVVCNLLRGQKTKEMALACVKAGPLPNLGPAAMPLPSLPRESTGAALPLTGPGTSAGSSDPASQSQAPTATGSTPAQAFPAAVGAGPRGTATAPLTGPSPAAHPNLESVSAHGYTWSAQSATVDVGAPVPHQDWSVRTLPGETIFPAADSVGAGVSRTPMDYFMAMFPTDQLMRMARLTSGQLHARGSLATTAGEILKLIGVIILATRYELGFRADLRSSEARNKYLSAPAFGQRTRMSRARCDALWSCLTFSEQPGTDDNTSEENRWGRINDFISSFNSHRESRVTPSELISVDESMCKWYGLAGDWIAREIPMYVAIDRKPENGCEIQNAACGHSGILLRLNVVTTAQHQRADSDGEDQSLGHGTTFLKRLVAPWAA